MILIIAAHNRAVADNATNLQSGRSLQACLPSHDDLDQGRQNARKLLRQCEQKTRLVAPQVDIPLTIHITWQ